MLKRVSIIVPTWNNPQFLHSMVKSVMSHRLRYPIDLVIVNNGHPGSMAGLEFPGIKIVQAKDNLGWEGGLNLGLQHTDAEFVCFMNDDAFVPAACGNWLRNLMAFFQDETVGAVGPTSNVVMGAQNIWHEIYEPHCYSTYLIGFCLLVRRKALQAAGGVHEGLPGGDDFDLSIRLRDAGYKLIVDRQTFVFHHGFKTGERVHGGADTAGGWNSPQMSENVNNALIRKHGFRKWYETLYSRPASHSGGVAGPDKEGDMVRSVIKQGTALELGCGATKTVPHAVGLDFYGKGEMIPTIGAVSVADIKGDAENPPVTEKYDNIIARHILEHCVNPIEVLKRWDELLAPGGKLIIAVPNENVIDSIPMNPEHKHTFTPHFLAECMRAAGMTPDTTYGDPGNGVSFVLCAEGSKIKQEAVACS